MSPDYRVPYYTTWKIFMRIDLQGLLLLALHINLMWKHNTIMYFVKLELFYSMYMYTSVKLFS